MRLLGADELPRAIDTLAHAFEADPLFRFLLPNGDARLRGARFSMAKNLTFYCGFGFEVLEELTLSGGYPPLWSMRRAPRK
jgi:hypothetical protein